MDTAEIIVVVGGVLLILFVLWFFFGARQATVARMDGANVEGADVYSCPMHPWVTSTDPAATCHICGMKLVKPS